MSKDFSEHRNFFSSIIGHQHQCEQFSILAARDMVPHAMLFTGPPGIGKQTIALRFAELLLSGAHKASASTDKEMTKARHLVSSGNHPDLHILLKDPAKKELSVESVRTLSSKFNLHPYCGVCSVGIVNNAHEMSIAACNALLKTLEEPPGKSFLFLITHAEHRLPETIISRCQPTHFSELQETDVLRILQLKLKGIVEQPQKLSALAKLAGNSLSATQLSSWTNPLTLQLVDSPELRAHLESLLQTASSLTERLKRLFDGSSDHAYAVSLASYLAQQKESAPLIQHLLREELRHKLLTSSADKVNHWAKALVAALKTQQLITERNANPQLQLSSLLLEIQPDW